MKKQQSTTRTRTGIINKESMKKQLMRLMQLMAIQLMLINMLKKQQKNIQKDIPKFLKPWPVLLTGLFLATEKTEVLQASKKLYGSV